MKGFEHFTVEQAKHLGRAGIPPKGRSKYGAVPKVVDGIRFDSKAEANRYGELKFLERAGKIVGLKLQPEFLLTVDDGTFPGAAKVLLGRYIADFSYMSPVGEIVEDVKGGPIPPLSRWKIKHCEAQYGIQVRIIR